MTNDIAVPLMNTKAQFDSLAGELNERVAAVLASGNYVNAGEVKAFEAEFAAYCDVQHAIGVANGTDALRLALQAVDAGPGTEVITVSHTFIATAEAIAHVGAQPRFVEVDPATANLDPARLEAAITERTAAIIPVHLYGRPADMDPIMEIAGRYGIPVIEDACQGHGARYKGRMVGSLGDLACFSFYPTKNLGAAGDGGAVTTGSAELAKKIRLLADHGSDVKYVHQIIGWNSRLDEMQAAVLRIKLAHLDEWNRKRRSLAHHYRQLLTGVDGLVLPLGDTEPGTESVYHLFVVRLDDREQVRDALAERGVASAYHYPVPIHLQAAFTDRYSAPALPVSEAWASTVLSLPMFPELTRSQVEHVASSLISVLERKGVSV